MARKNLLEGLMKASDDAPAPQAAKPRYDKGAIGAVSRSIEDLRNRSIDEIDPNDITGSDVQDRLSYDDDPELDRLKTSISEYGQQVPILVRPHPTETGKYQIVYGRRRVIAMRELGLPVKAMVRQVDDTELVLAQGQENSVRRDLSFIEKASFARELTEAGYARKIVCDALNIDKTVISRMLHVLKLIPKQVIDAIGPAPKAGRDRWLKMGELLSETGFDPASAHALARGETSDERFEAYLKALQLPLRKQAETAAPKPRRQPDSVLGDDNEPVANIRRTATRLQLDMASGGASFGEWLVENMPEIHKQWKNAGKD